MKKFKKLIIACDGESASGKSTAAKLISRKYKLLLINSGLLYRYASKEIIKNNPKDIFLIKLLCASGKKLFIPYKNQSISFFVPKNIPRNTKPKQRFGFSIPYNIANVLPQDPPKINHLSISKYFLNWI